MDNARPTAAAIEAFKQAVSLFQSHRITEAEALFKSVLQICPEHADSLHFLGLIAHQSGSSSQAAELISRALRAKPSAPMYCNLGLVQHALGNFTAAIENFQLALALAPAQAMLHHYLGNSLSAMGNVEDAAKSQQEAVRLNPGFASGFTSLGNAFHHLGRLGEAEAAYRAGLNLTDTGAVPRDEVLNELAMVLLKMGHYNEAVVEIKKALAIKPESQLYQRNLRALLSRIIPPWHFAMLADHDRNDAFRRAIEKHCKDAGVVLEIGTGSGLLAMMAAKAGARQVITCEEVPVIAENARRIIEANGYGKVISLYSVRSNHLAVGRELPERADVLIAEILSSEILAEGAMEAMADAKERLLKDNARIIPQAVSICGALVSSPALKELTSVNTVEGFDLSTFNEFAPFLITVPAGTHYEVVSETFLPSNLTMGQRLIASTVDLPVTAGKTATVHGILQWMKVFLDEETILENAPGKTGSTDHWGAVFHPFSKPLEVKAGQIVNIRCEIDGTSLKMRPV
jgi:tetratricopeptide (TPR) repeat protein